MLGRQTNFYGVLMRKIQCCFRVVPSATSHDRIRHELCLGRVWQQSLCQRRLVTTDWALKEWTGTSLGLAFSLDADPIGANLHPSIAITDVLMQQQHDIATDPATSKTHPTLVTEKADGEATNKERSAKR